jgi:N-acyl-D-aspartate/D-glutamate deacylase
VNRLTILAVFIVQMHNGRPSQAQNSPEKPPYDLVILNGTVTDPESGLFSARNVGITGGIIQAVTSDPLQGRSTIDAKGLVVAPGFIDLHQHGQDDENYGMKAMDGVTTVLELEIGTEDVDRWYDQRAGKTLINYGVSIGHPRVRMAVMHDPGDFLPNGDAAHRAATDAEIAQITRQIDHGLQRGALAVGVGAAYTEAASPWEILQVFRVAAKYGASCHVHLRGVTGHEQGLQEVLADSAISGAPLHVVHIQSTGGPATPHELEMIREARAHGLDVTTETYPYTAGMTAIDSAVVDDWIKVPGNSLNQLMWPQTGERLTRESYEKYRKQGGYVIMFTNTEEIVTGAIRDPLTMIASDGMIVHGRGHPRTAGTYSRILGHYVRETHDLTLMDALRKMTLMPAQRLERRDPAMKNKGRIRVGADADITVFDPQTITEKSTYEKPTTYSEGVRFVVVNGTVIVNNGKLAANVAPGQAVRAPILSPH